MKKRLPTFAVAAALSVFVFALPSSAAWPSEVLSGKVTMVVPDQRLLVIRDASGIPFDVDITAKTHILAGSQALSLNDLTQYQNKNVVVKFVPEQRGDVAVSIQLAG